MNLVFHRGSTTTQILSTQNSKLKVLKFLKQSFVLCVLTFYTNVNSVSRHRKQEFFISSELPFSVFMCQHGKLCFLARLLLFGRFLMVLRGLTVEGYIATFCSAVADNQSYWKSSWVDRVSPISVWYFSPGPKCRAASIATIKSHPLILFFVSCFCFTASKIICPEYKKLFPPLLQDGLRVGVSL